jgi:DMSO/TMAO reductase YedYZ molybdopterin-dependent catalytic subunit
MARKVLDPETARRVPPNQRVSESFPILHEGPTPGIDLATWDFRVFGLVANEVRLGWDELRALGSVEQESDFHCVTGWTKLANRWEGIEVARLLEHARPLPGAGAAMVYGHLGDDPAGYSANLPLDVLRGADVLLAHSHGGTPLTPDHGWPLRLVVPARYAWKSVKWVRAIEVLAEDRRGYWESLGYHNRAEPFANERFASQETKAPDDRERPRRMRVRGKDNGPSRQAG